MQSSLLSRFTSSLSPGLLQEDGFYRSAFAILAAAGGLLAAQLWRHGVHKALLSKLSVTEQPLGPYLVVYKTVTGPYNAVSQAHQDLSRLMVDIGFVHHTRRDRHPCLTVLHDNPKLRPAASCRASVAFIFKSSTELQKPEDVQRFEKLLHCFTAIKKGELQVALFPRSNCLSVEAPFISPLSILIASLRGYPMLSAALQKQPAKVQQQLQGSLEVYLPEEGKAVLAFPLEPREQLIAGK